MSAENANAITDGISKPNPVHYIWIGLPLVLIPLGGMIGGALGGLAAVVNYKVFQGKGPLGLKYLIAGATTALAGILWLILAFAITLLLGG